MSKLTLVQLSSPIVRIPSNPIYLIPIPFQWNSKFLKIPLQSSLQFIPFMDLFHFFFFDCSVVLKIFHNSESSLRYFLKLNSTVV